MEFTQHRKSAAIGEMRIEPGERAIIATVCTTAIDADSEVLLPSGCDLKRYKQNPVVLWSHNQSEPPVAKCASPGWIKYDKASNSLIAKMIFADTDDASEIFDLYKGGFLGAFSVGFNAWEAESSPPNEKEIRERPELAACRRVYRKWELFEFSCVAVPSNPEALCELVGKSAKLAKLLPEFVVKVAEPEPLPVAPPTMVKFAAAPVVALVSVPTVPPTIVKILRKPLTTADEVAQYVSEAIARHCGRL